MVRAGLPVLLSSCALLSACSAGPPPALHALSPTAQWHAAPLAGQSDVESPWRLAQPGDQLDKGVWWRCFSDPVIDDLVTQALRGNPSLQVALARVRQSRASAAAAGAALLPRLDFSARSTRARTSENRPAATSDGQAVSSVQTDSVLQGVVSYELDLFGRLSFDQQSAQASAEQAASDAENARLVLVADVVSSYFGVRSLDTEICVAALAKCVCVIPME